VLEGRASAVVRAKRAARRLGHVEPLTGCPTLRQRKPDLGFSGTEPLFVGKRRNEWEGSFRLSANSLADLFRQIYQQAGIVGASSHSGRRWFMTELARAGVHPRIIQQRAGHSSLATTQRYIEVTLDQERQAVRTIRL
jgi:integrase